LDLYFNGVAVRYLIRQGVQIDEKENRICINGFVVKKIHQTGNLVDPVEEKSEMFSFQELL
jgi:hypothetical protein